MNPANLLNGKKTWAGLIAAAVGVAMPILTQALEKMGVNVTPELSKALSELLLQGGLLLAGVGIAHKAQKIEKAVKGE